MTPCKIDGCEKSAKKVGWCGMHYERQRRHGSTDLRSRRRADPWPRIDKSGPGGCWLWLGRLSDGYGWFANTGVHRWSYEHHVGPIPEGLTIDHLCRVRNCVNPDHLEPVTIQVNVARSVRRPKTYAPTDVCGQGHVLDRENRYVIPKSPQLLRCRKCRAAAMKKYNDRKRLEKRAAAPGASPSAA